MKNITMIFISLFGVGLLISCDGSKTQEIASSSADKTNEIKISGTRATSFDPFQANIIINGFGQSDTLVTEVYAKDLNKESVTFSWVDNTTCVLTFIQQDDSRRNMEVIFDEDGNSLREKN